MILLTLDICVLSIIIVIVCISGLFHDLGRFHVVVNLFFVVVIDVVFFHNVLSVNHVF